jgi:DNA-binding protein Fis
MSEPDDIQQLVRLLDPRLTNDQTDLYRRALEQFDRVILRRALERCEGNLTRAAALLGLSRVTLRSKLRALGLSTGKVNASEQRAAASGHSAQASHPSATSHPHVENPQGQPHTPQPPSASREGGQDLTRQDQPGAGFADPHMGESSRREASGLHNVQSHK